MTDPFYLDTELFDRSAFRVLSVDGTEALSEPFVFEVVGEADFPAVSLDVVGRRATLSIRRSDGTFRAVHGRIRWFRMEGRLGAKRRVRVELVPELWIAGERRRKRIFQNKRVPTLVRELLFELGIECEFHLKHPEASYPVREYCVQYAESDVEFITRLLSEEGILFFFEHAAKATKIVFGDDVHIYRKDGATLTFASASDEYKAEHVKAFVVQRNVTPSTVVLRDYDFHRPALDQTVHAAAPLTGAGPIEVYEYPGNYDDPSVGKDIASRRLRELQREVLLATAGAISGRLEPGVVFSLTAHPWAELNRAWVVTRIRHTGQLVGEPTHEIDFECVPDEVLFLPRVVRRRTAPSVETAVVTGVPGEEITVDKDGRVHVHFHWDREGANDATSSCFMRVAQPWSGTGFGVWFAPRVGMEVVVSFVGGDPDRPLITGCVYNATHPLPVDVPKHKTRSTIRTSSSPGDGGFNELRFEDAAGKEQVYIHAQRNLDEVVRASQTTLIGGNRSTTIGGNHTRTIGGAETATSMDTMATVKGSYTVLAGSSISMVLNGEGKAESYPDAHVTLTGKNLDMGGLEGLRAEALTKDMTLIAPEGECHVTGKFTSIHGTSSLKLEYRGTVSTASLNADEKLTKLKSEKDLEIEGSQRIKVHGAIIEINADGVVTIQGQPSVDIVADNINLTAAHVNFKKK